MPVIHVELFGKRLVWLKRSEGSNWGPLALPEHVDEDGNVKPSAALKPSYAHVFADGKIRRYHEVIGTVDDLVRVTR